MLPDCDSEYLEAAVDRHFNENYHCAETVVRILFDLLGRDGSDAVAQATPFGGGFGKSFAEVCGVLAGGGIVIGSLYGRKSAGDNWDLPAELALNFREKFLKTHGLTNCGELRERFGEEEQMTECTRLVKSGVITLVEIIREHETAACDMQPRKETC